MQTLKKGEAEAQPAKYKVITLKKTAEVTTTAKHPAGAGKKRMVPPHQVENLLKRGMIEDPNKKAKKE